MKAKIFIILLTSSFALLTLCVFLAIAVTYHRNKRIQRLRNNLRHFSVEKLQNRIDIYENILSHKNDFIQIQDTVEKKLKIEDRKFNKIFKEVSVYATPMKILSFKTFNDTMRELIKKITIYQEDFLDLRFTLFDLTSDIEIEKAVIKKLKDQLTQITEFISNSPEERISNSKKLTNKINKIRSEMTKLEKTIDEEGIHLSKAFVESEEKIGSMISDLGKDVDFMDHNIKHLKLDLGFAIKVITDAIKENSAKLMELKEEINDFVTKIKDLKNEINEDIDNLKIKDANLKIETLNSLVQDFHLAIFSNIDYAKYNYEHDSYVPYLLGTIANNHGLFVSEIKRHRLENEHERLLYIQTAFESFHNAVSQYEVAKNNNENKLSPAKIHLLLMEVIYKYQNYISVTKKNVQDISQVNESTNKMNMDIARMNTALLQVEYNIIPLSGILHDQLEKEKVELQHMVKGLRDLFKDNTNVIDDKTREHVNEIKNNVDQLVEKTRGAAFEIFFIKETIMYINRFKGSDIKLDMLIKSLVTSFDDEDYTSALRKAKEIIEIYGMK